MGRTRNLLLKYELNIDQTILQNNNNNNNNNRKIIIIILKQIINNKIQIEKIEKKNK